MQYNISKISTKIMLIWKILLAKYFQKKPIMTTIEITKRCQSRCQYCDYWKSTKSKEMSTKEIFSLIDNLKKHGTRILHFTGGEPLLRKDIVKILAYAHQQGFSITINSNGLLLPRLLPRIKNYVNLFKLSLDGPRKIHNNIRGINSYDNLIKSTELIKKLNKKIIFTCVLSKLNFQYIPELLEIAKKLEVKVSFQLSSYKKLYSNIANKISLNKIEQKQLITKLRDLKKTIYKEQISNTFACLSYLEHSKKPIKCYLKRISIRISADKKFQLCGAVQCEKERPFQDHNFYKKYLEKDTSIDCNYPCWCTGRIELNLLLSYKLESIIYSLKNTYY